MEQLFLYYILLIKITLNCSPVGHLLAVILLKGSFLWLVFDFPCKEHRRL